jgi:hypothetical protein
MKKRMILILLVCVFGGRAMADEGMWTLPTLGKLNLAEMQAKGLKLSAEEIYSVNRGSLKDAVIIFGGGCTGEIVSDSGLILTNHHCGYSAIQQHSSVEHDYLKYGFWARNKAEEIPTPGLQVTFIRRIEEVTDRILPQLTAAMTEAERADRVRQLSQTIEADIRQAEGADLEVSVEAFFGGNQYIAFVTEVYTDVRMVGAPPSSIGKFGGNTDNWMWPRHTGDFSVFRVYSDKNGRAAEYSPENIPYPAPVHLSVSLKGVEEGDFTMIMGFPGRTMRYMTTSELDQRMEQDNPNRIFIRGERQKILWEAMSNSDAIRIQYASKYASSSNYWKNSIGQNRGLARLHVRERKAAIEDRFRAWVSADASRAQYAEALPLIERAVAGSRAPYNDIQYMQEALLRGVELLDAASGAEGLTDVMNENAGKIPDAPALLETIRNDFYKDYSEPTDRRVAKTMFRLFAEKIPAENRPTFYQEIVEGRFNNDYDAFVDWLYDGSIFDSFEKLSAFCENPSWERLLDDPAVQVRGSIMKLYREKATEYLSFSDDLDRGHRLWIAGLTEMDKERVFYPDANSTIRLTYGQVFPYRAADAVYYDYVTTLAGVMEKEDPSNPMEFTVPEKLKELYAAKDYGRYGKDGQMIVNFLSNNDITGGNSGSPVMNAEGHLIGLAFDGNWEAMSGDIAFEPDLQRCINVDIRYVLFIIDKFAGASHLIDEMTIVE